MVDPSVLFFVQTKSTPVFSIIIVPITGVPFICFHINDSIDFIRNFLRFTYKTGNMTVNVAVSFSLAAVTVPL